MSDVAVRARAARRPAGSSEKPTVVLVAHAVHDEGGMERVYAEHIRRVADRYRLVVVSSELLPTLRPLVDWQRVRVPRRPFPLRFVLFFVLAGIRIRRLRADLVHTLGAIVPNRVDIADLHFCHAGFVAATGHLAPEDAPALRKLNTSLARFLALCAERWCYRPTRLRHFAAVSAGVALELETHYPGVPVSIVPNGVDRGRYQRDPKARETIRAREHVASSDVIALFVGGDWNRKGLPIAIAALSDAPHVNLWVIGPGDLVRATAQARDLGVADRVRLFGARTDGEDFYSAADIFCLASSYETFSLAAHEAAAAGLPIVSTAVSGVTELVGSDEAGILVERDPTAFGAALERLARDEPLRARLGSKAQERAAERTWEGTSSAMLALDAELLPVAKGTAA